jgi:hypothetical protein
MPISRHPHPVLFALTALSGLARAEEPAPAAEATAPPAESSPRTEEEERRKLEEDLARELAGKAGDKPAATAPMTPSVPGAPGGAVAALLPNISAIFTGGAFFFSDTPTPRFPAHEPVHSTAGFRFQLQELEIALQSVVDPFVRADIFLALGLGGVEIEEGYLTTLALPWNLQARVGSFYASFGRFNTTHFLETQPFIDMPLANRRFIGGEQLRGLGAELSWLAPFPWFFEAKLDLLTAANEVSFGLPIDETSGPQDLLAVAHLKQFFALSDAWSLQWGLSAAQGPNNTGGPAATLDNRTYLAGTDLYLKWRDLASHAFVALQAEYILRRALVPGGAVTEGGLYGQVAVRWSRQWETAARLDVFGWPSDLTGQLAFGGELKSFMTPSRQWRAGAALTHYPSEFHRWRLQYNLDHLLVAGQAPVHEVFLQYQFLMGPHGAHAF